MALRLRPVELLLGGYAILVVAVSTARVGRYPSAAWAGAAHLLLLVLLWLLQRVRSSAWIDGLRVLAPLLLLPALYGAIDLLNGFGAAPTHDRLIQGWDAALFGLQPSFAWSRARPSQLWSTTFHLAYLAYYLIVPLPMIYFLLRRDRSSAERTLFQIMSVFVVCYCFFIFVPVAGPYYEFARPEPWFVSNRPAALVYSVLSRGSSYGAAFPSSHIAAAWAAVLGTTKAAPSLSAALAVPTILLTFGVVYCQMHYAADVIAGLLIVGLTVPFARWALEPSRAT